jgi:hypothetical protein
MSFIIEACKRQSRLVWGRRRIVFVESQTRDHDHGQSDAQDCLLLKIRMAVHRLEASVACLTVIFISYKRLEEIFDDEDTRLRAGKNRFLSVTLYIFVGVLCGWYSQTCRRIGIRLFGSPENFLPFRSPHLTAAMTPHTRISGYRIATTLHLLAHPPFPIHAFGSDCRYLSSIEYTGNIDAQMCIFVFIR